MPATSLFKRRLASILKVNLSFDQKSANMEKISKLFAMNNHLSLKIDNNLVVKIFNGVQE